jgi:chromosome segregation ATPase
MTAGIIERARRMQRPQADAQTISRLRELDQRLGELAEQVDRLESEIEDHDDEARSYREDEADARQKAEREEAEAQAKRQRLAALQPESEQIEAEIERILESLPDDEAAERISEAVDFQNY